MSLNCIKPLNKACIGAKHVNETVTGASHIVVLRQHLAKRK